MTKTDLARQLYLTAEHLRPLAETLLANSAIGNGSTYVKPEPKGGEPVALFWFVRLTTMASLIEAQESSLSARQIAYLKSQLLGGMGSLNDLQFSSKALGDVARDINKQLEEDTDVLFTILSRELIET